MEGPSLVIACDDLAKFVGRRVLEVSGNTTVDVAPLRHRTLRAVRSWGKHLLLDFDGRWIRVHFLMFGSYRVDERKDRDARLSLRFRNGELNLYSCSVRWLEPGELDAYDWSIDVMSPAWDRDEVLRRVNARRDDTVDDLLLDQDVFAGVGNIIKNEVLWNLRLAPGTRAGDLPLAQRRALVDEARAYSFRFLEWKRAFVLRKNWQVMRKRKCPSCAGPVTKAKTGERERWSYWCEACQPIATPGARRFATGTRIAPQRVAAAARTVVRRTRRS